MRINDHVRRKNRGISNGWIDRPLQYVRAVNGHPSAIEQLVSSHCDGRACKAIQLLKGGFNYCIRLRFHDNAEECMLRFPIPGDIMHPSAKVKAEVATMRFIHERTSIPVPRVIATGDFPGLGAYILMEYVAGSRLDLLALDDDGYLRDDIAEGKMRHLYRQLAAFHLQLASHAFNQIGSLTMRTSASGFRRWSVGSGPITFKSNEMERMGGVESKEILHRPYDSARAYVDALVDQSLRHLTRNPMVSLDEAEARDDYKAVRALQRAAPAFYAADDDGDDEQQQQQQQRRGFLLFPDDLRFGNIIVDDHFTVRAIIDWEFCYAAPASFLRAPPSWLIGSEPFEWDARELRRYDRWLGVYIELLREEEDKLSLSLSPPLSPRHDLSSSLLRAWHDGTFWINLAVRECFPLEPIMRHCWKLDPLSSLPPPDDMHDFGQRKMKERREYEAKVGACDMVKSS